ncbi:folylpolyglutamate synthase/dihydrofolate synthase family protein [Desulfoluna sp.]|uniref:bifunctional folylpolyglutamate synthase/dihydrofolate synthase n=1 Tax=Desulfoluna sp. TaxID=2045199 RepID=UPI0026324F6F|nr:folylpolyglutamate synthase/dihydrofolate synthase family protein [Desulfoluna sp.]
MTLQPDYERCLDTLYKLGRFGIILGLDTMKGILSRLDNPEKKFTVIHISGTNGKGSVASYLTRILSLSGYRTGLYTSPHLVRFNERIQVDGEMITDDEVVASYNRIEAANSGERSGTFFELTTAMAFDLFAEKKVEIAVIETGMGGRLDATNLVTPALSIITNISLEHKAHLGDTIAKIAYEKAGIIKEGVPAIIGVRQASAIGVVEETARELNAPLLRLGRDIHLRRSKNGFSCRCEDTAISNLSTALLGKHQVDNAALAVAACTVLRRDTAFKISDESIRKGLATTSWPGRLERVANAPETIIDGAHNPAAIKVLVAYLEEEQKGRDITLITGILDDKAYQKMFASLLPFCRRVILVEAQTDRSLDPETMRADALRYLQDVSVIRPIDQAITAARTSAWENELILVAGSLYVAGEARAAILGR